MAVIQRPSDATLSFDTPLQVNTAVGQSIAAAGRDQQNLGRQIQQQSNNFLKQANNSIETAMLTRSISEATKDINEQVQARVDTRTDRDGNPTFGTLVSDVGEIANKAKGERGISLVNPRVREAYEQHMTQFVNNKQMLALKESRSQHIAFSRNTMFEGVNVLTEQALTDEFANIDIYTDRIQGILESGVASGALNPIEARRIGEQAMSQVRLGHWQKQIEESPEASKMVLDAIDDPSEIGLTHNELNKVKRVADATVNDRIVQATKVRREVVLTATRVQNETQSELELGIIQGKFAQADIEKAASTENLLEVPGQESLQYNSITNLQRLDLLKKLANKDNKERKKAVISQGIMSRVNNSESLVGFTKGQIGDAFLQEVAASAPENGQLTLTQMSQKAARFKAPVTPMQENIEFAVTQGSLPESVDAIRAYDYLVATNSVALDGMEKDAGAVASMASHLIRNTNMTDSDALKRARESIIEADDSDRALRQSEFRRQRDFKTDNMRNTIIDMHDEGLFDITDITPAPGVLTTFSRLLREEYVRGGDVEGTKASVKRLTKDKYGETPLADGEFMLLPPDKAFPGITNDVFKTNMVENLTSKGIKVSEDNLFIESDAMTVGPSGEISYSYWMRDDEGNRVPVEDPVSEEPMRWRPNEAHLLSLKAQEVEDEALLLSARVGSPSISEDPAVQARFGRVPLDGLNDDESQRPSSGDVLQARFGVTGKQ